MLPRSFPRAPVAFLSAVLSPLAWQFGRPDLFDTYSVGILLMQLCGGCTCCPLMLSNVTCQVHCVLFCMITPRACSQVAITSQKAL